MASLYLYLQTVAPVAAPAPVNQLRFPFNLRFTLRAWNRLFHDPQTFKADASKSAERSEEHTSELQSLMRISYAVFCLKKKTKPHTRQKYYHRIHPDNKVRQQHNKKKY